MKLRELLTYKEIHKFSCRFSLLRLINTMLKKFEIHIIPGQFQSKMLTVKNKNINFQIFLSPSIKTTYEPQSVKNSKTFGSKLHTRLIIEAGVFYPSPRLEYVVFCGDLL